jgi:hypothetical protein
VRLPDMRRLGLLDKPTSAVTPCAAADPGGLCGTFDLVSKAQEAATRFGGSGKERCGGRFFVTNGPNASTLRVVALNDGMESVPSIPPRCAAAMGVAARRSDVRTRLCPWAASVLVRCGEVLRRTADCLGQGHQVRSIEPCRLNLFGRGDDPNAGLLTGPPHHLDKRLSVHID